MNTAQEALKRSMDFARMVTTMIVGDLTDENLLERPCAGANHVAWQLGHLIASEHRIVSGLPHAAMPPLPDGFADNYTPETSKSDTTDGWETKARYLELYEQQRAATLKALEQTTADELALAGPENMQRIAPTVGDAYNLVAAHELMHVGQYTTVRRKLGMAPAF